MVEFCSSEFRNICKTKQILWNFEKNTVISFAHKNGTEINIFYSYVLFVWYFVLLLS